VVVAGTPIDLARALRVSVPVIRARYSYRDRGAPGLANRVDARLDERLGKTARADSDDK